MCENLILKYTKTGIFVLFIHCLSKVEGIHRKLKLITLCLYASPYRDPRWYQAVILQSNIKTGKHVEKERASWNKVTRFSGDNKT